MTAALPDETERAKRELERWLVSRAEAGVPELALVDLLRASADYVEATGYVPRGRPHAPKPPPD